MCVCVVVVSVSVTSRQRDGMRNAFAAKSENEERAVM